MNVSKLKSNIEIPVIAKRVIWRGDNGYAPISVTLNPFSDIYDPDIEDEISQKFRGNKYDGFVVVVDSLGFDIDPVGRQYVCSGSFVPHPKFGDQFVADYFYEDIPTTKNGLKMVLMELPHIKSSRALAIIKMFGVKGTIDMLDNSPSRLLDINGINESRLEPIKEEWEKMRGKRNLILWLGENGAGSGKLGNKIYEKWGVNSIELIKQNPYIITDLKGIGFSEADDFAHKILKDVPKPYRTAACIKYVLKTDVYKEGNLCTPYSRLATEFEKAIREADAKKNVYGTSFEYVKLISPAIKDNLDHFVAIRDDKTTYVYLKDIWEKEKLIAKELFDRNSRNQDDNKLSDVDIEDAQRDIAALTNIDLVLDDTQKEAIKSAFENKLTIITGGGGTGKSTICRGIYYLACKKRLSIRLMSPTGKAAQVLSDKTQSKASTIHRSLKLKPGGDYPEEKIREQIILIDEFSMVGIDTVFAIFYAMAENPNAHIVMVGDCNQLPSVSPGNFLTDFMASGCVNVVRLDKIHRQGENSYISVIANDISNSKVVRDIPEDAIDIKWQPSLSEQLPAYLTHYINEYLKTNDIKDLQIIAPMYKGQNGITNINTVVQDLMRQLNDTSETLLERPFQHLYMGDRVIQWENNYQKEVFNGDMGIIVDLGKKVFDPVKKKTEDDYVVVEFYGEEKIYIGQEIDQLKLAWCCSIHKYQGSQSPYVMMVLQYEARRMMTKELVYTAMTRAEKYLFMFGSIEMFRLSPTQSTVKSRYTNLQKMVLEYSTGNEIFKVLAE